METSVERVQNRRTLARLLLGLGVLVALLGASGSSAVRAEELGCIEGLNTIVGTSADEVITGTAGDDVISALEGNDVVDGGAGDDFLCGGPGNDVIGGGEGGDVISGDEGDDQLNAGPGYDYADFDAPTGVTIDLGAGQATGWGLDRLEAFEGVNGSDFDDRIFGDDGVNDLRGFQGDDSLVGRGETDYFEGDFAAFAAPGNDVFDGGPGEDVVYYSRWGRAIHVDLTKGTGRGAGSDRFRSIEDVDGSAYADTITGDAGPNWLRGFGDSDRLNGGRGPDLLQGGSGRDRLDGGPGRDQLNGGPGRDRCLRGEANRSCP
jgi:Ca2+-binding RTX toxin-like protein